MRRTLGATALISLLFALAVPGSAQAKPCGSITLSGGQSWIVGGAGLSCKKMRRWSRSMLKGDGRPKGWNCRKSGRGSNRSGGCSRGPNGTAPFFIYYPPH